MQNLSIHMTGFFIVWLFDQSSGHCAYDEDALNVLQMNLIPEGKQPVMRTTVNPLTGKPQSLVIDLLYVLPGYFTAS